MVHLIVGHLNQNITLYILYRYLSILISLSDFDEKMCYWFFLAVLIVITLQILITILPILSLFLKTFRIMIKYK